MTREDVVALSLRITSLIIVMNALSKFSATFLTWDATDTGSRLLLFIDLLVMLLPLIVAAIVSIVLWKNAFKITHFVLEKNSADPVETKWTLMNVEKTAFSIIGLYVLTYAIPSAFKIVYVLLLTGIFDGNSGTRGPSAISQYIYTGAQLIMGFWLLFGAKGLHNLLRKSEA